MMRTFHLPITRQWSYKHRTKECSGAGEDSEEKFSTAGPWEKGSDSDSAGFSQLASTPERSKSAIPLQQWKWLCEHLKNFSEAWSPSDFDLFALPWLIVCEAAQGILPNRFRGWASLLSSAASSFPAPCKLLKSRISCFSFICVYRRGSRHAITIAGADREPRHKTDHSAKGYVCFAFNRKPQGSFWKKISSRNMNLWFFWYFSKVAIAYVLKRKRNAHSLSSVIFTHERRSLLET